MLPGFLDDSPWQMSRGERAAVIGVLAALRPALAIELGSAEGAGLRETARYAEVVHSFDLTPPTLPQPDNVVLHTGDSHELLGPFLESIAAAGTNVDFVLVDGDHSPEGVRQDLEDLLDSPALASTTIQIHDTANERVRAGIDAVRFETWPKVGHVELDWVPGQLFAEPSLYNELWFGLGLVSVDAGRRALGAASVYEPRFKPAGPLLAELRRIVMARAQEPPRLTADAGADALRVALLGARAELREARERGRELAERLADAELGVAELQERLERSARALADITGSPSWRLTEPLRTVKRQAQRRTRA
jgi:hypothetical protein